MGWAAVAGAAISAVSKFQGAQQAEQIGNMNAGNILAETNEAVYRKAEDFKRNQATMRARMAASGVKMDSESYAIYDKAFEDAHARDIDWMRKSGQSQADIARYQAKAAKQQGYMGALGSAAKAFGAWWEL